MHQTFSLALDAAATSFFLALTSFIALRALSKTQKGPFEGSKQQDEIDVSPLRDRHKSLGCISHSIYRRSYAGG